MPTSDGPPDSRNWVQAPDGTWQLKPRRSCFEVGCLTLFAVALIIGVLIVAITVLGL